MGVHLPSTSSPEVELDHTSIPQVRASGHWKLLTHKDSESCLRQIQPILVSCRHLQTQVPGSFLLHLPNLASCRP
jgi:hypothetical protein